MSADLLITAMIPNALPSLAFRPRRVNPYGQNTWIGHLPFVCDLISQQRPGLIVELGTHYGESYFGFCQSVIEAGIECQAYAVDSWKGDEHAGTYGEEVYEDVSAYNQVNYSGFSTLLRMQFDEALTRFDDGTIDLLHIDGLHTYEAVCHDYRTWFSRVRPGGVVLLHDIAVRGNDFGVWKLWDELAHELPTFAFHHCNGLGVVGKPAPFGCQHVLADLLSASPETQSFVREYYQLCGERLAGTYGSHLQHCRVQLFWGQDHDGSYSENRSTSAYIPAGGWEQAALAVAGQPADRLRLDPAESPGLIEIAELAIRTRSRPDLLWRLDRAEADNIVVQGSAVRVPAEGRLVLFSSGTDPQVLLPRNIPVPDNAVLEVLLRVRTSWSALAEVISTWSLVHATLARSEIGQRLIHQAIMCPEREPDLISELVRLRDACGILESRAQDAESRAQDAESRAQDAESRAEDAAALQQQMQGELKRAQEGQRRLEVLARDANASLQEIASSWSWTVTAPLRKLASPFVRQPRQSR